MGILHQWGDYTRFIMDRDYWNSADRAVLGLEFEDDPFRERSAAMRLPAWFSNLLPEGRLREWVARERRVSPQREMELLAQLGHDLPGAVVVVGDAGEFPPRPVQGPPLPADEERESLVTFSLAGVGLKFSLLQQGDRLTIPASGEGGDWIVKLPDAVYPAVPLNEATMMTWAAQVGIDVPEHRLFGRDELPVLPAVAWPNDEQAAYGVRRFDRGPDRARIHIEDLAQVRNFYETAKYDGDHATVAALLFRGHDVESLREFTRRVTFNVLIGNGDAHLKNWSLIYPDGRHASVSPAYDLVATAAYLEHAGGEDLGMKFLGSRRFSSVRSSSFLRLQRRLTNIDVGLQELSEETAERTLATLNEAVEALEGLPLVARWLEREVPVRARWFAAN